MKRLLVNLLALCIVTCASATDKKIFRISTENTDLILQVAPNGRLYQSYLGEKLKHEADVNNFSWSVTTGTDGAVATRGWDVYSGAGNEDFFEPGIEILHNDGNPSTYLTFQSADKKAVEGGMEYIFNLKDPQYPVYVTLHYVTYPKENIIKQWTEIRHQEKNPITMQIYASSMLYFSNRKYFLTEFSSDWGREAQMLSQQLQPGKKILDSKLGSRAAMFMNPFFELGFDQPVSENSGKVLMGTIGWTGNFRFTFEIDNAGHLRVISGINPFASNYELEPDKVFTTPEFIFTLSYNGTSQGSRNFQSWARNYSLKDGKGTRLSLLNNWENTYFDFNQEKLANLMKEAKTLGVDMFLLDDGWFGNKYPRKDDHAGLGDWEATHSKLPGGIPALVKSAKDAGVKFGIWIEPEMVNPKSKLFETHPDWAITLPNRKTYYYRNQLVLDMSNPDVQDYVFGIVDHILTDNPEVAFFKWDCNSPITNIYSHYLKNKQNNLYVDHVLGIYNVLKRIRNKYPNIPMMLCSGGGARCDYEALKYFTEFWCSDNTDPIERLFIQWGFSQFFPAKAMCAHVTNWNRQTSVKFRTDVASMCKLGFDIDLKDLTADELKFCQIAVKNWHRLQKLILDGTQYRLVSPYETNHMALNYVSEDTNKALLFAFDIHPRFQEKVALLKLQGLDADKTYKIKEINLMPNQQSSLSINNKTYSGDFLMKIGIPVLTASSTVSHVVELTAI